MNLNKIKSKYKIIHTLGVMAIASVMGAGEVHSMGDEQQRKNCSPHAGTLTKFSDDAIRYIISYLPIKEMAQLPTCNKYFRNIVHQIVLGDNYDPNNIPHNMNDYIGSFFRNNIYTYVANPRKDGQLVYDTILNSIKRHIQTTINNPQTRDVSLKIIAANHYFNTIEDNLVIPSNLLSLSATEIYNACNLNMFSLEIVDINNLAQNKGYYNSYFRDNPKHCLVIETDEEEVNIRKEALPDSVRHIAIYGPNVTTIRHDFLKDCDSLTTIDLSPLSNLTSIGDYFLKYCLTLETVDLSPLSNVTRIGDHFLRGCDKLKTIDLSTLSNVTSIGDCFLACCSTLKTVVLTPLSHLTSIQFGFLCGCQNLTAIDLSPLSQVTHIGYQFLGDCSNLTKIDLRTLINVKSVGGNFLKNCNSLTFIHLTLTQQDSALHHAIIKTYKKD